MHIERGLLQELGPLPPCVLTLGSFDGLHRAHQALIQRVVEQARQEGLESALLTFEPHPREILQDERPAVARLTLLEDKLVVLKACGLDRVILLRFTAELAAWEATRFLREGLLARFGMRHLVVGDNHAFGRGRSGDTHTLREASRELAFGLEVMDPVILGGERISSTRVRRLLAEGRVEDAAQVLGRPFRFSGKVEAGRGRGRGLGFPTANVRVDEAQLLPLDGVYAVAVDLPDGRRRGGMMNLGPRPTFGETARVPEIHLFQVAEELYGQGLRVDMLARVRDTLRFNSGEQLATQLQEDRHRIQDWLEHNGL